MMDQSDHKGRCILTNMRPVMSTPASEEGLTTSPSFRHSLLALTPGRTSHLSVKLLPSSMLSRLLLVSTISGMMLTCNDNNNDHDDTDNDADTETHQGPDDSLLPGLWYDHAAAVVPLHGLGHAEDDQVACLPVQDDVPAPPDSLAGPRPLPALDTGQRQLRPGLHLVLLLQPRHRHHRDQDGLTRLPD